MNPLFAIPLLYAIYKLFKKSKNIEYHGMVDKGTIEDVLNPYLPEEVFTVMTDNEYKKYDDRFIDEVIKAFLELNRVYSADYDCDNYAIEFYSLAERMFPRCMVGVEFDRTVKHHAMNFYLNSQLEKIMVEPQTGIKTKPENSDFCPDWSLM